MLGAYGRNIPLSRSIAFPKMIDAGVVPIAECTDAFMMRETIGRLSDQSVSTFLWNTIARICFSRDYLWDRPIMPFSSFECAMVSSCCVPMCDNSASIGVLLTDSVPLSDLSESGHPNIP